MPRITSLERAIALVAVAIREIVWGLPLARRELRAWRRRAAVIADAEIRHDALSAIERKQDHATGAALFAVLPRKRDRGLLRLLVAYQTLWDYLDDASERDTGTSELNGRQLHLALSESLSPGLPLSDYYRYHPWRDDGGYLSTLVGSCRDICSTLPGYQETRDALLAGVLRCSVQSLNHERDPQRRARSLRAWAAREFPHDQALAWFELTAAASAFLPHVLLALGVEAGVDPAFMGAVAGAYFPWVSLAIAMLDSYADRIEDEASDNHSYISHYAGQDPPVERLCEIVTRARESVAGLPRGGRHTIIVCGMVAMYLSKEGAQRPEMRDGTRAVIRAGGSTTRLLLPLLQAWRLFSGSSPTRTD